MVYHMVMSRREVLVQLDDQLVADLDRIAVARGLNRSELLRRAAAAIIEAYDLADADSELAAAYRRQPPDPVLTLTAARLAGETSPPW